ncbi:hypothetical protein DFR27_2350 [Umboniibacter marinipuniceus]|uniref:Uncharacterized protein n=1 Tax=Umboniibacter marinipuniceus TaxID=569599 RepID=A0A3M0A4J1_9GAMM|nr:hypothetical protein DFR27_2350 [Umboniibacter marinipuniceus]
MSKVQNPYVASVAVVIVFCLVTKPIVRTASPCLSSYLPKCRDEPKKSPSNVYTLKGPYFSFIACKTNLFGKSDCELLNNNYFISFRTEYRHRKNQSLVLAETALDAEQTVAEPGPGAAAEPAERAEAPVEELAVGS